MPRTEGPRPSLSSGISKQAFRSPQKDKRPAPPRQGAARRRAFPLCICRIHLDDLPRKGLQNNDAPAPLQSGRRGQSAAAQSATASMGWQLPSSCESSMMMPVPARECGGRPASLQLVQYRRRSGLSFFRDMPSAFDKFIFDTVQNARISWFFGQKLLAARVSRPVPPPPALRGRPMPDRQQILADLRALFAQDWHNIEQGYYAPPQDGLGNPFAAFVRTLDFFADLTAVEQRRRGGPEGRRLAGEKPGRYPRYYLQSFHFQSDGYLSAASAERYDHQVEVLFGGAAAAMRRQALVPLRTALQRRRSGQPVARLLDVACGTGGFLREVKRNFPRLSVTGLDLSSPYLEVAQRRLADWSRVSLVE